ncbi:pentatricopeptide repeat-containing protein At5g39710 [Macadamia integrifolia]|uniref:pentatricopeptide repeat-containing protein At5g39710 n=1 Tax=Macadamia integrifolia TaxID=60698 RepID=UPI001C4F2011|nr:pentatricopeptide repeat-containing protein At5g39710 [Macadamia integrifolia]XP_042502169.1 pentatricopeptide repeat-containing protein At5g39710 [Macadamia integrifolia]XP_042502170.1 pentatricopeptide repeat-containing protein At5g39710 [Macadamia integrifolia]
MRILKHQDARHHMRALLSSNASFSSRHSQSDAFLSDKAYTLLKMYPNQLDSLASQFTPQAASLLLLKSQFDQTLTLKFLNWARNHSFLDIQCKCLTLHILTRFNLYKMAQSIAEVMVSEEDDCSSIFECLKSTYHLCNSSSSVIDLLVKSYAHLTMVRKALITIDLAKYHGFMPGILSYNSVLDAMFRSRDSASLAEEFYGEMIRSGVSPNVYTYNILLRGCCVEGKLDKAFEVFSEMESKGCAPNVVTFNTLVDGSCKLGKINEAFRWFELMSQRGLQPNLISYNVIINGLCREGRIKETHGVLEEMGRKGMVPDKVTYNTLVNGHCREGNIHQALILHAEMIRMGISPNVVTYTALINSMCKAGNLNRAMEFLDEMRLRGLCPNEITYTTLIDGFSKQGYLNEANQVLKEMTENGFSPSIVTFNAFINGSCILGRMDEALRVIQDMIARGLDPDVVSYSTIITGFCRNRDLDKAFEMKQEMVGKGVFPDAVTYSSLIQGLCEQSRLVEACNLFHEMLSMGLPPDEFTYTTLINGYCMEGDVNKALILHDEMIQKGLLPDVVTYSVLIKGLSKQARTREARQLLFRLFYDESVPSDVTYDTLIGHCSNTESKSMIALIKSFCMKGLMDEADQVFESMTQRNWKPNEAAYNVIIHGHSRSGNVRKAFGLYEEMTRLGFIPNIISVLALIKALFNEGMNNELSRVINDILRSCRVADAEISKILVEINHKEGNMDAVFNVLTEMAKNGLLPNGGEKAISTV